MQLQQGASTRREDKLSSYAMAIPNHDAQTRFSSGRNQVSTLATQQANTLTLDRMMLTVPVAAKSSNPKATPFQFKAELSLKRHPGPSENDDIYFPSLSQNNRQVDLLKEVNNELKPEPIVFANTSIVAGRRKSELARAVYYNTLAVATGLEEKL